MTAAIHADNHSCQRDECCTVLVLLHDWQERATKTADEEIDSVDHTAANDVGDGGPDAASCEVGDAEQSREAMLRRAYNTSGDRRDIPEPQHDQRNHVRANDCAN